ncbi:hypothetical protein [Aquisalimonas sp.]|uniref:hypothetical protein n=1 Tax=Aquisalimonas sp. TaxID=1872621 RepID=UPI0025B99CE5|nr:hypothetical protein [Aquisalimonas sp.]
MQWYGQPSTTASNEGRRDTVWSSVLAIVEERGYDSIELEQGSERATYTTRIQTDYHP